MWKESSQVRRPKAHYQLSVDTYSVTDLLLVGQQTNETVSMQLTAACEDAVEPILEELNLYSYRCTSVLCCSFRSCYKSLLE